MTWDTTDERYDKFGVRKNAFRHWTVKGKTEKKDGRVYQREIWTSAEVPYGIINWDSQVTEGSALLTRQRYYIVDVGRFIPLPQQLENEQ